MADILSEGFEAAGYDDGPWSLWTMGGSYDPDYDTSLVAGAPAAWGARCLRYLNAWLSLTRTFSEAAPVTYFSGELIYKSLVKSDQGSFYFMTGAPGNCWVMTVENGDDPDAFDLILTVYGDTGAGSYVSQAQLIRNTPLKTQVYYDTTNDVWEWYLDGQLQHAGTLTGSAVVPAKIILQAGFVSSEIYFDNVKIDSAAFDGWAQGILGADFSSNQPGVAATGAAPGAGFTETQPGVTATGAAPGAGFSSAGPAITFTTD